MNNIYNQVIENLSGQLDKKLLLKLKHSKIHLGIFAEPYLKLMLEGKKTIESRFSKHRIAPFDQISTSDIVLVKESGGNVIALLTIKEILFFNLDATPINDIKNKYQNDLCVTDEFWNQKKDSHYATLILIDKIIALKPFPISKKGMQSWIVLN